MSTVRERFKLFLDKKELSQSEFARIVGYNKKNISGFLTGSVKMPKMDFVILLAKHFPELNLRWFLLGEEHMFSNKPQDATLFRLSEENSRLKDKIITLLEEK